MIDGTCQPVGDVSAGRDLALCPGEKPIRLPFGRELFEAALTAAIRVTRNTPPAPAGSRRQVAERAPAATAHLVTAMRAKVGRRGPPWSRPGEPPRRETGELMGSISGRTAVAGNMVTGIVTVSAPHAARLEYGKTRIAARPFARSTLGEELDRIAGILRG